MTIVLNPIDENYMARIDHLKKRAMRLEKSTDTPNELNPAQENLLAQSKFLAYLYEANRFLTGF